MTLSISLFAGDISVTKCWKEMLQLNVCLQHYCFGGAINPQRDLKLVRDG